MAWKESGGGADDPCVNHEEGETLLEAEDRVVSSEDVTDSGAHANPQQALEEQPLITASETSMAASSKPNKLSSVVKLSATPKLSRKECSIAPIHSSTTVTSSSSPKTSSSTSRNSKVPIVINLDPSDRVSLNTGSTLSVRTSPAHGKDGSSSSAAPAPLPIPLQRSAVINNPMLPRNSQASHRNNDNEACIQVANIESDPSSPDKEYEICSSKNLCGPNPKKVTVIVALILSIWASFILGVNIHKKVVTMEDRLSSMTQKMLELQIKYLDLQKKSSDEIISLHDKLHQVLQINNERSQKESVSNVASNSKKIEVDKRFQTTTKKPIPTTTTTLAAQTECLTKNGQKCILPFTFEGNAQEGCVHRWKDTAAWCAIKVDESGAFIDDKSSWDYCDDSCPLAPQQKDDDFWNSF